MDTKEENSFYTQSLDYPPVYANGNLHMGHLYESCLYYSYYNLADTKTLTKRAHYCTINLLNTLRNQNLWVPKNVTLNLGFDENGLPTTLAARKILNADENNRSYNIEELFLKCRTLLEKNITKINGLYQELGLNTLRDVKSYRTGDLTFKLLLENFLSALENKNLLEYGLRPHLYCPNCKTFIANSEVSEAEVLTKEYEFLVFDRKNNSYAVMTKRPQMLPGAIFFVKNPADQRYKHLKFLSFEINNVRKELPVYDSKVVNASVGTGLVYITAWGGLSDYKIIKELDINIDARDLLHDKDGRLRSELLTPYGLKDWADVTSHIKALTVVKPISHIRELQHTERSSCKKNVVYLLSKQVVIKLTQEIKSEAIKRIKALKCDKKVEEKLISGVENFKQWCISRNNQYYSLDAVYEKKTFKVDTWAISCLTPLVGTNVTRCQGSDIVNTWALYTILAQTILDRPNFEKLIVHKMVVDPFGQKFSKSKSNSPDLTLLLKNYEKRILRHYFCEKPLDKDINFNEKQLRDISKYFKKVENLKIKLDQECFSAGENFDVSGTAVEIEKTVKNILSHTDLKIINSKFSEKDKFYLKKICAFYSQSLNAFDFSNILFEIKAWMYNLSKKIDLYTKEELKHKYGLFLISQDILNAFN